MDHQIVSNNTQGPSLRSPAIASVKRRYTGPFLPCPKAKRMALMDKKDGDQGNVNTDSLLEDCVDFAVESSKADNVENVQVIESGSEQGDSTQEDNDVEQVFEQIIVEPDPNENNEEEEGEEIIMINPSDNVVLINDDVLTLDEPRIVTPPPTDPAHQVTTCSSTKLICECPSHPLNGSAKIDLLQLSPQVILNKSKKMEQFLKLQEEVVNVKTFETYTMHGYELRHFQIILTDYYQGCRNQNSNIVNIDSSPDTGIFHVDKINQQSLSTPTKEIINSVKSTEGNVSTPEFMARYEDCVAEKLLSIRKRLDTPEKAKSPLPNKRLNFESQPSTSTSVEPLRIETDIDKQPMHPRTRLRLSPVKINATSSSLIMKYMLRKSAEQSCIEVSDSDTDSQCSVMTISDIEYTSSGKKKIRVKEEYVSLSDDTELEELEAKIKFKEEVDEFESDVDYNEDEACDGDNEREDDSSSTISNEDNYLNTLVKTENVKCEIKEEITEASAQGKASSLYLGDEESMENLLDAYHKVKRKQSAMSRSFPAVGKSPVKPSLISHSKRLPSPKYNSFIGSHLSSRYRHHTDTDTDASIIQQQQIKPKPLCIKLVKLSKKTVENVIDLCSNTVDWRDDELLEKAGLSLYDITRIGIVTTTRQNAKYSLRQFVKKKKIFEVFLPAEKPKPLSKKLEPKIKINRKELKKLKRKKKMKEKQEAKQKEKESIRRALLRINNRFISQNRFWAFIDGGSSENHPILL